MKNKYNPNKMYQGNFIEPKKAPLWVEYASLITLGVVMGGLFAYGLVTATGG